MLTESVLTTSVTLYGYTPIHLALRCGHVEMVEKLLSLGADVNVADKVSVNRVCVNY